MCSESFPKARRLVTQDDFLRVYRSNVYAADRVLVIRGCRSPHHKTRIGLAVSRKVGNAVRRNRWKRVIREAFRQAAGQLPAGLDIVVRPRKGGVCRYRDVRDSLIRLSRQMAGRLNQPT